jgi:hypothetical protein
MSTPSRPQWYDRFLTDLPAFERFAAEMRRWQINSDDAFERCDAALWSRLNAEQACWVFNQTVGIVETLDASGALEAARSGDNAARREAGMPELSATEYRTAFVREFAQQQILQLIPTVEA